LALTLACGSDEGGAGDQPLDAHIEETIVELRALDRGVTDLGTQALKTYVEDRLDEIDDAVEAAAAAGEDHLVDRAEATRRQVERELRELDGLDAYERADARLRIAQALAHVEQRLDIAGHPVAALTG
jgi:hypothetical protein